MTIRYMGDDKFPQVLIEPDALQQFKHIVNGLTIEAEWYGFVKYNKEHNYLLIMGDSFVPEQVASGTSADATPQQIMKMLERIDDHCEADKDLDYGINDLGIHMHSHVRLDTSPSSTDEDQKIELVENYQREYLNDKHPRSNPYFIKGIMNQKDELFLEVIDLNTLLVKETQWFVAMDRDVLERLDTELKNVSEKQFNNVGKVTSLQAKPTNSYYNEAEYIHVTHDSSKRTVEVITEDILDDLALFIGSSVHEPITTVELSDAHKFVTSVFNADLRGNFTIKSKHLSLAFMIGEKTAYSFNNFPLHDFKYLEQECMYGSYGGMY